MAVKSVIYKLLGDSAGLKAAAAEGNKALGGLADTATSKLGAVGGILSKLGPAGLVASVGIGAITGAATAAAAATFEAVTAAAAYADRLKVLEASTGIGSKSLQALDVAAKLGNTSLETLSNTVGKMQKGLNDSNPAFQKLGLSAKALKDQAPDEALRNVAQAIESIESPAERSAARIAVFGKSGNELADTLSALASGAGELGGALSDEALKASAELADKMDLLDTAMERVKVQFGAAIAQSPALGAALDNVTDFAVALAETIEDSTPRIVAAIDKWIGRFEKLGTELLELQSVGLGIGGPLGALLFGGAKPGPAGSFSSDLALNLEDAAERRRNAQRQAEFEKKHLVIGSGGFAGKGDEAGEALAQKRKELVEKAIAQERQRVNAWHGEQLQGALELAARLKKSQDDVTDQHSKEFDEREKAYEAMLKAISGHAEQVDEEQSQRIAQEKADRLDALAMVSDALFNMGSVAGGALGTMFKLGSSVTSMFVNLGNQAKTGSQKVAAAANAINVAAGIMQGPGGGKGALSGAAQGAAAGAAFGGIGAAVGAVAGGILGLFGGPSDAEKAAARQGSIDKTIDQLEQLKQKVDAIQMEKLQAGVGGVAALFAHLGEVTDLTQDRFNNVGLFGAVMFQQLREEGMSTVEAFKAMTPALEQAAKVAEEQGLTLEGTFGALAEFADRVGQNQGLVDAVEGMGSVIDALAATGNLNQDSANSAMAELTALMGEMETAGFSAEQRVALAAQALFDLQQAAKDGRISVDAETQALIDLAEASGAFEGLDDPMAEIVEALEMMNLAVAELVKAIGGDLPAAVRAYIDEINKVPGLPGVPSGPGVTHGPNIHGGEASGVSLAGGGVTVGTQPATVHGVEGHIPLEGGGAALIAAALAQHMGAQTIHVVVQLGERNVDEFFIEGMRGNRNGLASETARHLPGGG